MHQRHTRARTHTHTRPSRPHSRGTHRCPGKSCGGSGRRRWRGGTIGQAASTGTSTGTGAMPIHRRGRAGGGCAASTPSCVGRLLAACHQLLQLLRQPEMTRHVRGEDVVDDELTQLRGTGKQGQRCDGCAAHFHGAKPARTDRRSEELSGAKMSCSRNKLNATTQWWFSSTDWSLNRNASSVPAFTW